MILFVGDTHGDVAFAARVALLAKEHAAEIVQVGDFGFLWPGNDRLDQLSAVLVECGVVLRFCDGNHDDHPRLKKLRGRVYRHGVEIAPHVIYQPRGSVHEDKDGTRFLFCGGAPSIDRAHRLEGVSWWPEEVISQNDFTRAMSWNVPVHVLVTHDAPAFPPGFSPKGSPHYREAQRLSMKHIDKLLRAYRPPLHVHGHWHTRATTQRGVTRVEALDCNHAPLEAATLLWSRQPKDP